MITIGIDAHKHLHVAMRCGRRQEAVALFDQAISLYHALNAEGHDNYVRLASAQRSLADHFQAQRQASRALALYREALAILESHQGTAPLEVAGLHAAIGATYLADGDVRRASSHLTVAAELFHENLGPGTTDIPMQYPITLANLGALAERQHDFDEAMNSFAEAAAAYRVLVKAGQVQYRAELAAVLRRLGDLRNDWGSLQHATAANEEAVGIYRPLAVQSPEEFTAPLADALLGLASNLENITPDDHLRGTVAPDSAADPDHIDALRTEAHLLLRRLKGRQGNREGMAAKRRASSSPPE